MSEKTALKRGAPIGCYHASAPTALACGVDADERMVRRCAECMADPNNALHRLTVSNAVAARTRAQLERGEVTMAEIRADHARYCE